MKIKTATGATLDVKDERTAREILEHTDGWSAEGEQSEKKNGRKAPDISND